MTDHSDVPLMATGDWIDAAWINQYIGDNVRAWRQAYTQQGAMAYAADGNTLAELAPPAGKSLLMHPGGAAAPSWLSTSVKRTQLGRVTSNQTISANATANIQWNLEDYDDEGLHDLVTNPDRITFPAAGAYLIIANIFADSNAFVINMKKNNSTTLLGIYADTISPNLLIWFDKFAANDYITISITAGALATVCTTSSKLILVRLGD